MKAIASNKIVIRARFGIILAHHEPYMIAYCERGQVGVFDMRTPRSAAGIVQKMKEVSGCETDAALADYMGISKVTIASWKKRDSVPLDKCIYFSQKSLSSIEALVFEGGAETNIAAERSDVWAYGVAIYFYERARGSFLYGTPHTTALWWGRALPALIEYYRVEVFALAEAEDEDLEAAAVKVMEAIDRLEPKEMTSLLEKRLQSKLGRLPQQGAQ